MQREKKRYNKKTPHSFVWRLDGVISVLSCFVVAIFR